MIREGMGVEFDVPIEMDDGAILRADIYLPLAEGPHPVLLTHGPYGKGLSFQDAHFKPIWEAMIRANPETAAGSSNRHQVWELPDPERWTNYGYACVRVDSRGAGRSPGVLDLLGPREVRDHYECIEWAGRQPWSTGKVGLLGISYYAINQWLVAAQQPPHLAAMFAFEGAADMYRDLSRHGGILSTFWRLLVDSQIRPVQHGVGVRGYRSRVTGELVSGPHTLTEEQLSEACNDLFEDQKAHPLDDLWHRERSPDWSKVTVPFLSAGNWAGHGLHLRGNTEAFLRAASEEKHLEMHGLEHWTHFYTEYGIGLQRAFFDRFLKGDMDAFEGPRVRLQVRHPGNRFVERHEAEWPLARTRWTKLFLDAGRAALSFEPPAKPASISYLGLSEGVTFLSEPLAEPTEITGPLSAHLDVSSSTEDADLFVVFRVFNPEMKEIQFIGAVDPLSPVAMGWLRASHRKLDRGLSLQGRPYHTHDERQPLTPGEPVRCDVEVWPTSIVVPAGYRLGLSVRGRDYVAPNAPPRPIAERGQRPSPNGVGPIFHDDADDRPTAIFNGRVTLHTGGGDPSHLLLPVIP